MSETDVRVEWQAVHASLQRIAKSRAGLDADEARWLREAERLEIWLELGHGTLLEYMEHVLGYGPRTALDRLRVARELGELPVTADALAHGELGYSAVRELTRVAIPSTEAAWVACALGKNLREVETSVAGHKRGDLPTDPPRPEIKLRTMTFEVTPATFALLREARRALDAECGERLDDDQLVAVLCRRALEGGEARSTQASHQVAVTVCARCDRAWQDGAGATVELSVAERELAACDAEHIGPLDAAVPERAMQDVTPATRRLVWARDHGRCSVPGCRASRNLDLHHVVARSAGGKHDPSNLTIMCSAHHRLLHDDRLTLTGCAPDALVFGRPRAPAPDPGLQVRTALVSFGYEPGEARSAVEAARAHVGTNPTLETWFQAALAKCHRPCSTA